MLALTRLVAISCSTIAVATFLCLLSHAPGRREGKINRGDPGLTKNPYKRLSVDTVKGTDRAEIHVRFVGEDQAEGREVGCPPGPATASCGR